MGGAVASAKNRLHSTPDINVTPLVDVVLVLLIIFMVVAPAINEGAAIELPKVLTPDAKPRDIDPIEVLIAEDGTVIVEEKRIALPELRSELARLHAVDEKRSLLLKSDERARYQRLRETFALVQDLGFKGVLLKVIPRT
jgi:biopolymer transport protein ExbD/biopolymer transport protein TolR